MTDLPVKTWPSPGNPDPQAVQGGEYTVDPTHTRVVFSVSHMGFSSWNGDFVGVTGTLTIDLAALEASILSVEIPAACISTTNAIVDKELRGPSWIDADRFPRITFVSTSIQQTDPRSAEITGDLTFHGVTRAVTLKASFNGSGVNPFSKTYTIGFDGQTQFKRSDFGVGNMAPMIGDLVTLRISAEFSGK